MYYPKHGVAVVINGTYVGATKCKIQARLWMSVRAAEAPLRLDASGTATGQWNQPRSRLHFVLSAGHEADTGGVVDSMLNSLKTLKKNTSLRTLQSRVMNMAGITKGMKLDNPKVQKMLRKIACLASKLPLSESKQAKLYQLKQQFVKMPMDKDPCSTSACESWEDILDGKDGCEKLSEDQRDVLWLEYQNKQGQDAFDIIWYWICFFFIGAECRVAAAERACECCF